MPHPPLDPTGRRFVRALGDVVRAARREARMRQEDVAARVGAGPRYVGTLERGETNPSIARLHSIATTLGTSPARLLRRVELALRGEDGADEIRARLIATIRRLPSEDLDVLVAIVDRLASRQR